MLLFSLHAPLEHKSWHPSSADHFMRVGRSRMCPITGQGHVLPFGRRLGEDSSPQISVKLRVWGLGFGG